MKCWVRDLRFGVWGSGIRLCRVEEGGGGRRVEREVLGAPDDLGFGVHGLG